MQNYEAIMKMSIYQMEAFLDEIYCAGLNMGLYAARIEGEKADEILGENPFSIEWLTDEAEAAVLPTNSLDDQRDLLNTYVKAALLTAGIKEGEEFEASN